MKHNETKKQEQKTQTQTQQPVIRVQSRLRAGAVVTVTRACDI